MQYFPRMIKKGSVSWFRSSYFFLDWKNINVIKADRKNIDETREPLSYLEYQINV